MNSDGKFVLNDTDSDQGFGGSQGFSINVPSASGIVSVTANDEEPKTENPSEKQKSDHFWYCE